MAFKARLTERLKQPAEVQIHVPPPDPGTEAVKSAESLGGVVQSLVVERNTYKQSSEWYACQYEVAQQTIERLKLEHDHSLQLLANEREYWRKLAIEFIRISGRLQSTIDGMDALRQNAKDILGRTSALAEQVPQMEPIEHVDPVQQFDGNGMPQQSVSPPPTDLEGIRALAEQLNRVAQ